MNAGGARELDGDGNEKNSNQVYICACGKAIVPKPKPGKSGNVKPGGKVEKPRKSRDDGTN